MASSLLPPNATEAEKALVDTIGSQSELSIPIDTLYNAQKCPVSFLPFLAWAVSVDFWDPDWPEQQKRDIIAESLYLHSIKGTIGAVRRAVRLLGYEIEILENKGGPAQFEILADITGNTVYEEDYEKIESVVLKSKNARSHLTGTQWIS